MIKLNYGYFIDSHTDCGGCTLKKYTGGTDKKGEAISKNIGYYGTVESALSGYIKTRQLDIAKSPEAKSIQDLFDITAELKKEIGGKL